MNSKKLIAFTLIELLVVIAIVGILSGFVLVSLNSATDSANDARRKSDLSQIVKALLVYNTSNPTYPIETCSIGSTCSATVNNALGQASGITGPNNTYYTYSSIDGTSFTVSTIMSDTDIYSYDSETGYSESPAEPGLPGYAKRQPITINSASALTDYQVKLTITYDSDMQPDFDDLRFTSADGTTELSYWLESKTDSTTAIVWVKVPSLVSGDNTLYMYYANASAITASNGDNTFEFFDDFLGSSLDTGVRWTLNAGINYSVSSSNVTVNYVAGYYSGFESKATVFKVGTKMIFKGSWSCSSNPPKYMGSRSAGAMNFMANYNDQAYYGIEDAGITYLGTGYTGNRVWEIRRYSSTDRRYIINNTEAKQGTASISADAKIIFMINTVGNSQSFILDYVFIAKTQLIEPTSSFDAEQSI